MIIWIASYPKSGNTWVRSFLSTYLYSSNDNFDFDLLKKIPKFPSEKLIEGIISLEELKKDRLKIAKQYINLQKKLNLDNSIKFLKTHNACLSYKGDWFTDENNTAGYIYLVRDPRSVVLSYAHYANIDLKEATKLLLNSGATGSSDKEGLVVDIRSSWKNNYLSWKKARKYKGLIIRYEDLVENSFLHFKKILLFLQNYMDIKIDDKKIKNCINSCEFKNLKKMEKNLGFYEAIENRDFFRKADINEWKKEIDDKLKYEIESNFKNEMKELGYI